MNTPIHKKILETIQEKHIQPVPKWRFALENNIVWILIGFITLLGSVAVSTTIFILTDHDWTMYEFLDKSVWKYIALVTPYLWIIVLAFSVFAIGLGIPRTKRGYRYSTLKIFGASIIASLCIGAALYVTGLGEALHNTIAENVSWYDTVTYTKKDAWFYPEKGLLSGTILSVADDSFTIQAPDKSVWTITSVPEVLEEEYLYVGKRIKLVGEKLADGSFQAEDIRNWNE